MNYTLRLFKRPDDYERLAEILTVATHKIWSVADCIAWEKELPAGAGFKPG